jgi:hypothetical protein
MKRSPDSSRPSGSTEVNSKIWERVIGPFKEHLPKEKLKRVHMIILGDEVSEKLSLIHNLKKLARSWKEASRRKEHIILSPEIFDEETSQDREEDEAMEAWKHIPTPISYHFIDVYDSRAEGNPSMRHVTRELLTMFQPYIHNIIVPHLEVDYRITIWSIHGTKEQLLEEFVNLSFEEDIYEYTVLVLAVDLSHPWTMMNELDQWLSLVHQVVDKTNWLNEKRLREGKRRGKIPNIDQVVC